MNATDPKTRAFQALDSTCCRWLKRVSDPIDILIYGAHVRFWRYVAWQVVFALVGVLIWGMRLFMFLR